MEVGICTNENKRTYGYLAITPDDGLSPLLDQVYQGYDDSEVLDGFYQLLHGLLGGRDEENHLNFVQDFSEFITREYLDGLLTYSDKIEFRFYTEDERELDYFIESMTWIDEELNELSRDYIENAVFAAFPGKTTSDETYYHR